MNNYENSLIANDTYSTLLHVRCVIVFLQDFYCLSDIPGKRPPQHTQDEVYTGLFFIMQAMEQALAFEMTRVESHGAEDKSEKNK